MHGGLGMGLQRRYLYAARYGMSMAFAVAEAHLARSLKCTWGALLRLGRRCLALPDLCVFF